MTTRPLIHPAYALFTLLLASCSADFVSGMTKCSATKTCPEGFTCNSAGYCATPGGPQTPAGVDAGPVVPGVMDAGPRGTGGTTTTPTGTGGMPTTPPPGTGGMTTTTPTGTGGMTTTTPDAGAGASCEKPELPVLCKSPDGKSGVCAPPGSDCTTVTMCGDTPYICKMGEVVNCQYKDSNPCSPKGNMCPTGRSPMSTLFCPAKGGAGPVCVPPAADCSTLQACPDELVICPKGYTSDCKYKYDKCGPVGGTCTNPMYPVFCAGTAEIGPGCWAPMTDCTTLTVCEDESFACLTGSKFDCAMKKCVPK